MGFLNGTPGEPPEAPDPLPPKSNPGQAPSTDATQLFSDNGLVLPIIYGTVRASGHLIERAAYIFYATQAPARQPSTTYALAQILSNQGNLYIVQAITTGITGTGGGPSGTGTGQVDGGVTWDYVKMGYRHALVIAYCEGQIYGAGKAWQDKNVFAAYTSLPNDSYLSLALGTPTGGRPTNSASWFTIHADVYGKTAVLWVVLNTGSDADVPLLDLEIKGVFADATHTDANPADMAVDILTHARRGSQWPATMVDAVSTGAGAASWKTYCTATGFVFSWLIDSVQSGKQLLAMLLAASNTDAVWTNRADGVGGMLKFVPRGTDSITANGVTFTPNLTPAYALGQDDYQSTIDIDVIAPTDTYNSFPIEYTDRASDYKSITVDDPCMDDVDLRGLARANTTKIPLVMAPAAAVQLSRIKAQRSLNVANTYRAKLNYRFLLLEPTDLVTITEPDLGLLAVPARVTVFEEDQATGEITITCEDFPGAVGAAVGYTPEANSGFKPTVTTANDALFVLPGKAAKSVVADTSSTRGASVDNLWPNPTSEIDPPDGVDTTTAEWAGRLNAGGGAYAGSWVRQLTAVQNAQQILGETFGSAARPSNQSQIGLRIPCSPGEVFYIEGRAKWITVTGAQSCGVYLHFLDAAGAELGTASAYAPNNGGTAAGWAKVTAVGTAPAGALWVRCFPFMDSSLGAATAQFDAIYARRSVSGPVIGDGTAWFGQVWAAVGNVDLNGGTLVVNNSVNIASYGAGATYNTKASVRLTWSTPPAAFAPGGSVYPLVTAQAAYGGNITGRRLVPVGLIGSPPTAVDLQLFESNGSSTAPVVLTGLEVFHVHILFVASTPGYSL